MHRTSPPDSPSAQARHVFVYGTLRRGCSNDITRLSPAPRWVGLATVAGVLYHLGHYPGMVLDDRAGRVQGEVYAISPALEAMLDAIEEIRATPDSEYFKRHLWLPVQADDGAACNLPCLCYEYNRVLLPAHARVIASGDWLDAQDARPSP